MGKRLVANDRMISDKLGKVRVESQILPDVELQIRYDKLMKEYQQLEK